MSTLITCLVAFGFGFIGSIPLTGPIAVMVLSLCVQKRFGAALRVGLGAALAEALYAAVAFWGFTTFLANRPAILPLSHALSALVLTLLGVYFIRWKPVDEVKPEEGRSVMGFLLGFSISALNPTLLATWSAAVAALYARQLFDFSAVLALPFGAAAGAGVACWELLLVWLLRRYESRLPRSALTWVVQGMGLLLIAGAVLAGRDLVREL
ncbi:LysE family transporter [Archangium violaceum]|uniref:LysE family transporter n=1 Tax=Archangium violaceum TaxID=83451 RepID=UPI00193C78A4|nr:LysE family transporter [Archangium violaceum]QRK13331.1 LysE family transporter [Archangium violaceum]